MPDFRAELYRRYVSGFKRGQSERDEAALEPYWAWCRVAFLPLLDELDPADAVLELGCGPGHMLAFLRQQGFRGVEGLNVSEEQVRIAAGQGLNARVANVFEFLGTTERRFRAILALDFIEHFSREELLRLLPLVHRALEERGMLIVQTPNGSGLFPHQIIYGDLTHMTILTPESLKQLFCATGFDEFTFRETGPVAKNLAGAVRLFLWRLIRGAANTVRRIETGKSQALWTENMICRCRAVRQGSAVQ